MREIRVTKTALIETMKANREAHSAIVVEAQEGFKKELVKRLDEMLKEARAGRNVDMYVGLAMPSDHTKDYDTVIGMLELDINDYVDLDMGQYRQWVEDDWGWRDDFMTTNAYYSATAAKSV